jgi:hypothetical protein
LELFKLLWQFLLLAVLGGAVGLFFKNQEAEATERREATAREAVANTEATARERERQAARRRSLLQMRVDLVKAYNKTKAIRRLLRASRLRAANGTVVIRREEYVSLLQRLSLAQLEFESYVELVISDRILFPSSEELRTHLEAVEGYLNDIVSEFEEAWNVFADGDQATVNDFQKLEDFIRPLTRDQGFDANFKEPFRKALALIQTAADNAL